MSLRTITGGVIAALASLALAACAGTPGALSPADKARMFIEDHTQCPRTEFGDPAWSADGSQIFYVATQGSAHNDIRVITSDPGGVWSGTGERLLTGNGYLPMPSPDGKMLMFAGSTSPAAPPGDILIMDLATLKIVRVISNAKPGAWSPDSRWVAYSMFTGPGFFNPLSKTNVTTGETIALSGRPGSPPTWDEAPRWSPDGQLIAYQASGLHDTAVTIIRADGRVVRPPRAHDPTCVTSSVEAEILQGWLPDRGEPPSSSGVLVTRLCDIYQGLWIIGRDGSERQFPGAIRVSDSLEWSPDGSKFLFNALNTLTVADGDGSHVQALRQDARGGRWSPDGKRIAFVGHDAVGTQAIFVMNADPGGPASPGPAGSGTGVRQLTRDPNAGRVCLH